MSIEPTRRSVVRVGAWAAPAILLATAAPAQAASQPRRFVASFTPSSKTQERGTRASTALTLIDATQTGFSGAVQIIISGMYLQDSNYLATSYDLSPGWSSPSGSSYSSLTFSWTGTLPPGGPTQPLPLYVNEGSGPYPLTSRISASSPDVTPSTFTINWT